MSNNNNSYYKKKYLKYKKKYLDFKLYGGADSIPINESIVIEHPEKIEYSDFKSKFENETILNSQVILKTKYIDKINNTSFNIYSIKIDQNEYTDIDNKINTINKNKHNIIINNSQEYNTIYNLLIIGLINKINKKKKYYIINNTLELIYMDCINIGKYSTLYKYFYEYNYLNFNFNSLDLNINITYTDPDLDKDNIADLKLKLKTLIYITVININFYRLIIFKDYIIKNYKNFKILYTFLKLDEYKYYDIYQNITNLKNHIKIDEHTNYINTKDNNVILYNKNCTGGWVDLIANQNKTIEGREYKNDFKSIKIGDFICLYDYYDEKIKVNKNLFKTDNNIISSFSENIVPYKKKCVFVRITKVDVMQYKDLPDYLILNNKIKDLFGYRFLKYYYKITQNNDLSDDDDNLIQLSTDFNRLDPSVKKIHLQNYCTQESYGKFIPNLKDKNSTTEFVAIYLEKIIINNSSTQEQIEESLITYQENLRKELEEKQENIRKELEEKQENLRKEIVDIEEIILDDNDKITKINDEIEGLQNSLSKFDDVSSIIKNLYGCVNFI